MTSDYREALEMTLTGRTPNLTKSQENMILQSIPEDRFVHMYELLEIIIPKGITKNQIFRIVKKCVDQGLVTKIVNLAGQNMLRVVYRRKNEMDE